MRLARERVGTVLKEKWRLDKLLGVGGMAVVYSATHRNGKRVAIKMLHMELSTNLEVKTRFLREGYLANAVDHAGAVSVLDDDITDDGAVFLVMELLEGETLERRWDRKDRHLPPVEVLSIANQLLDVLAAAHAKEIVHRDIKPENVFLTREGQIKVLDFGIARLRELSAKGNATQTGAMMGTPAFMPPEQARGRWDDVDARSDVWATGATMFALLTGRFVHEADTVNEQLLSAMTNPAPRIATLVKDLEPEVAEVIDRALAFKKEERWADARAMQEAIRRAYQASHGSQPSVSIPAAPRLSAADAREISQVAPFPRSGSQVSGSGQREIVTTARGIVNAPSAAPPTLPSAAPQRRTPFAIGAVAAVAGVGIALAAFAVRGPGRQSTTTATAPIQTSVILAPTVSSEPKLPSPADQVPIADTPPAPPATGVAPTLTPTPTPTPTPRATPTPTPTATFPPPPSLSQRGGTPVPAATGLSKKTSPGMLDRRH